MSAFYEALAEEARALLTELGQPITFKRYGKGGDLVAGTAIRALLLETQLSVAIVPASGGTVEAFDVRFMSDVKAGTDVRFGICSTLTPQGAVPAFQPGPGDVAEFEGREWDVMGNTPVNVDGTPVVWSIGFKGP